MRAAGRGVCSVGGVGVVVVMTGPVWPSLSLSPLSPLSLPLLSLSVLVGGGGGGDDGGLGGGGFGVGGYFFAEVGGAYGGVGLDLLGVAVGDERAEVEDVDVGAEAHDQFDVVFD